MGLALGSCGTVFSGIEAVCSCLYCPCCLCSLCCRFVAAPACDYRRVAGPRDEEHSRFDSAAAAQLPDGFDFPAAELPEHFAVAAAAQAPLVDGSAPAAVLSPVDCPEDATAVPASRWASPPGVHVLAGRSERTAAAQALAQVGC